MAARKTWTPRQRLKLFEQHNGRCHICGEKIAVGEAWEVEHVIPFAMGGADDDSNCAPAHEACHSTKTKSDVGQIAKANRVRAKHFAGKPKSKFPGGKGSKYKRTVDGRTIRRDDE